MPDQEKELVSNEQLANEIMNEMQEGYTPPVKEKSESENIKSGSNNEQNEEQITDEEKENIESSYEYDDAPIDEILASGDEERIKLAAIKKGWYPNKEKFKPGTGKKFIDAEEFLAKRELYDRIGELKKVSNKKDEKIETLLKLNLKQHDMLLKEREEWAAAQKNAAKENSNIDDYERYKNMEDENKKEREELKKKIEEPEISKESLPPPPIVIDYFKRNSSWIVTQNDISNNSEKSKDPSNRAMTTFFLSEDKRLAQEHPEWTADQFVKALDSSMKQAFPHRFTNKDKEKPAAVAFQRPENISRKSNKASVNANSLGRVPREIAESMAKATKGIMTVDEYAQQLYDDGALTYMNGRWEFAE